MTTTLANKHNQLGLSIIELLISSFIGIIVIGIIGSIFINGQKIAKDRGLELLLIQNLTSTMQIIKEDVQRAGYNGTDGLSVKLSGAINIIETTPNSLGFVYHKNLSGTDKTYQNIVYKHSPSDKKLKICEKETLFINLKEISNIGNCNSLLDEKNIHVTSFSVTSIPLITSSATSSIIDIHLYVELANMPEIKKDLVLTIKQRNWQ